MAGSRFADDSLAYVSIGNGHCNQCSHVGEDGLTCAAFADAIPVEILVGRNQHRKPYPGDHGLRFEPKEPPEPQAPGLR